MAADDESQESRERTQVEVKSRSRCHAVIYSRLGSSRTLLATRLLIGGAQDDATQRIKKRVPSFVRRLASREWSSGSRFTAAAASPASLVHCLLLVAVACASTRSLEPATRVARATPRFLIES